MTTISKEEQTAVEHSQRLAKSKTTQVTASDIIVCEPNNMGRASTAWINRADIMVAVNKVGFLEQHSIIVLELPADKIEEYQATALKWLDTQSDNEGTLVSKMGSIIFQPVQLKNFVRKAWSKKLKKAYIVVAGHGRGWAWLYNAMLAEQNGQPTSKVNVSVLQLDGSWNEQLLAAAEIARLENLIPDKLKVSRLGHLTSYLAKRNWCAENGVAFKAEDCRIDSEYHKRIKLLESSGTHTQILPNGQEVPFYQPFLIKGQLQVVDVLYRACEYAQDLGIVDQFLTGKLSIDKFVHSELTALMKDNKATPLEVKAALLTMCSPFETDREKTATAAFKAKAMTNSIGSLAAISNSRSESEVENLVKAYTDNRLKIEAMVKDRDLDLNLEENRVTLLNLLKDI